MTFEDQNNAIGDYCHRMDSYTLSLDAMHFAEESLLVSSSLWYEYCCKLETVMETMHWRDILHATAAHKAEAFLRTIKQWETSCQTSLRL